MNQNLLIEQIKQKQSFLCVGLDVDLEKIPSFLKAVDDPLFEFSKAIVDATAPYAVAFKPNIAFFEAYGAKGWTSLEKLIAYLNNAYPEIFTIADAKRGDIGNTAARYAIAFFETLGFDAVTVAPYMGRDAVEPFLTFSNKHAILLGLTSNKSATDFQYTLEGSTPLYEKVLTLSQQWKNASQLMYVVGATKPEALKKIRTLLPQAFLLVPGVGAQGGQLAAVANAGLNAHGGLLVNSSRGIIYAGIDRGFAKAAAKQAQILQQEMQMYLSKMNII
ncbi:MAG: orotidine-5'-phosphate decarboxylase [Flavobacteriaceae bacterium]